MITKYYKAPGLNSVHVDKKLMLLNSKCLQPITCLETELCFYVETNGKELSEQEENKLKWILGHPQLQKISKRSFLEEKYSNAVIIEIGPRLNFSTPFSTNAVSICHSIGLIQVIRLERSIRYCIRTQTRKADLYEAVELLYDRMLECVYHNPIESLNEHGVPETWSRVNVLEEGEEALRNISDILGLSFDDWDIKHYTHLFKDIIKRNPTTVECFDLAQSNSEHSRHWFFKGKVLIDGEEKQISLLEMVMNTQQFTHDNSIIKFSDNSSAIEGFNTEILIPEYSWKVSAYEKDVQKVHLTFTAETHNFPTAVCPFSGAATGVGGRIRDIQAVGRGGDTIAGTAGYLVGNLLIQGYKLPWEEEFSYTSKFAKPLEILIEGSNGASDYGNKFGEPIISGFTRSFGLFDVPNNERREYVKPIMFSGGIGKINFQYATKLKPQKDMLVAKLGGPVYRIGVGGGSASSVQVQGDNKSELDFGAVQRGDAEMEQKLNRVIRSCLEHKMGNPILSIHDQGAGGNGNVLKELVEPEGAIIFTKGFTLGDRSISTLDLWGAEYQESNAILCRTSDIETLRTICSREKCCIDIVGSVTGNGKIILTEKDPSTMECLENGLEENENFPVNLDLALVLKDIPRKEFILNTVQKSLHPLCFPQDLCVRQALERVLRLVSVGSKRFLTNKVDRSVTGLIAQQQCVGPLHTPIADVAVVGISYFDKVGTASSIGEQPIKGILDPGAGARMSVAEAISNLVFAPISSLQDVKCSANWMWPAKLPGEGAKLYQACEAMCEIMKDLGIAVDGGKDSLSMATRLNDSDQIVKSPGTLVISAYAPCTDISSVITPDLKSPFLGKCGMLLHVDISQGQSRVGGTALSQCFKQLGNSPPDLEHPLVLKDAFCVTQHLLQQNRILSGHDISDGGLIVCLLEMCFGGICGIKIDIERKRYNNATALDIFFSEECGWVLECEQQHTETILGAFKSANVPCYIIGVTGESGMNSEVIIKADNEIVLRSELHNLLSAWEETSFQLEKHQMNVTLAKKEYENIRYRHSPVYKHIADLNPATVIPDNKIAVAVIREEGINGDREMAAALFSAGFEVWDVTMQDLLQEKVTIDRFRGLVFPGGFSYADVLGSAKGWAASVLFCTKLSKQFEMFYNRSNTFSLGVCNGCQLMALLGWIGVAGVNRGLSDEINPAVVLTENDSNRFESRFSTVRINESKAVMFSGMEGSVLGVWIAHGEGKFCFQNENIYSRLNQEKCFPLKYVDDDGNATEDYPYNPNGSPGGVAGICSPDGRHLAVMPHPERCVRFWQWPYIPPTWKTYPKFEAGSFTPWFQMFLNAFNWCGNDDNV